MSTRKIIFSLLNFILLFSLAMMVEAAVELASFEGEWDEETNEVTLRWETGSEISHSVFKVWRSTENLTITGGQIDTDQAEDITEELADEAVILSPSGGCNAAGNEYEYNDQTVAQAEVGYYYYLESFNCESNESEFFGSLDDEPNGLFVQNPQPTISIYLPIITLSND